MRAGVDPNELLIRIASGEIVAGLEYISPEMAQQQIRNQIAAAQQNPHPPVQAPQVQAQQQVQQNLVPPNPQPQVVAVANAANATRPVSRLR